MLLPWATTGNCLRSQCRRAAASIAGNIAEGCGRNGDRELPRFVRISSGSASELDSHLIVALDQEMADTDKLRKGLNSLGEVRGMLASLAQRLNTDD